MATRVADRIMVDTNVFLAATDRSRVEHQEAQAVLNDWPQRGTVLYASGQILREYLGVATRPIAQNGLGLPVREALTNVRAIRGRVQLLAEDAKVSDRLLTLMDDVACGGKQVHDANVVATMLVHGVESVVTLNVLDFARFSGQVRVIGLPADGDAAAGAT
jgi:predicted nucleic acid-binding protein